MNIDVYDLIQEKDLTPDMKLINSVCGIENTRKILKNLGGVGVYVPKLTRMDTFVRDFIKVNNHKSIKEIAQMLNVSEQYLRNLKKRFKV